MPLLKGILKKSCKAFLCNQLNFKNMRLAATLISFFFGGVIGLFLGYVYSLLPNIIYIISLDIYVPYYKFFLSFGLTGGVYGFFKSSKVEKISRKAILYSLLTLAGSFLYIQFSVIEMVTGMAIISAITLFIFLNFAASKLSGGASSSSNNFDQNQNDAIGETFKNHTDKMRRYNEINSRIYYLEKENNIFNKREIDQLKSDKNKYS